MEKITKDELDQFFNKFVSVGVPHLVVNGKLFFYFGFVKFVDSEIIKLETNNGFKIIPVNQIRDIHITRREK